MEVEEIPCEYFGSLDLLEDFWFKFLNEIMVLDLLI